MRDRFSLSQRGYGIPFSRVSTDEVQKIKDELTVEPQNLTQFIVPTKGSVSFPLYRESKSKLYVPKYYGLQKFGVPEDDSISTSNDKDIKVKFSGNLRPEQIEPVQNFIKATEDPKKRGGIINLSCAGGKTVIGIYLIGILKKKTMIIVHKNFLLEQWKERINQFMPDARVGFLRGKTVDVENKDIVIASLQSLSMKEYNADLFKDIGFLIVDEIHRTGTEVFSQALIKVNFEYSLGLTATLERKDGLTKVFIWSIGDVVYKNKGRIDKVHIKCIPYEPSEDDVSIENYNKEDTLFNGKPNTSRIITNITEYYPRTKFIVNLLRNELISSNNQRRFLILSDRKNHLFDFEKEINSLLGDICGMYIGGMKECELKKSEKKQVILATYAFASEGFDVPGLDTLILASPKSSMEQIVGRILREKEENRKNVPLILDIYDTFSFLQNQFVKRRRYYKKMKYTFL